MFFNNPTAPPRRNADSWLMNGIIRSSRAVLVSQNRRRPLVLCEMLLKIGPGKSRNIFVLL
jgi:hypothetical protein